MAVSQPSIAVSTKEITVPISYRITPMEINFSPSKRRNVLTITNGGNKKLYLTFGYSAVGIDKKMKDISSKGYFSAVPNKLALEPGETQTANVFIRDIKKIPEAEYILYYTPVTEELETVATDKGTHFACKVVTRLGIRTKVSHNK